MAFMPKDQIPNHASFLKHNLLLLKAVKWIYFLIYCSCCWIQIRLHYFLSLFLFSISQTEHCQWGILTKKMRWHQCEGCVYLPLRRASLASRRVARVGLATTMVGEGAGAPSVGDRRREKTMQARKRRTLWNKRKLKLELKDNLMFIWERENI